MRPSRRFLLIKNELVDKKRSQICLVLKVIKTSPVGFLCKHLICSGLNPSDARVSKISAADIGKGVRKKADSGRSGTEFIG